MSLVVTKNQEILAAPATGKTDKRRLPQQLLNPNGAVP
jgi:hypothetical protein